MVLAPTNGFQLKAIAQCLSEITEPVHTNEEFIVTVSRSNAKVPKCAQKMFFLEKVASHENPAPEHQLRCMRIFFHINIDRFGGTYKVHYRNRSEMKWKVMFFLAIWSKPLVSTAHVPTDQVNDIHGSSINLKHITIVSIDNTCMKIRIAAQIKFCKQYKYVPPCQVN